MKVSELIKHLERLPHDKEVLIFWDGGARGDVEGIVNDDHEAVIVGEWSIYRDGSYRSYEEHKIMYG